MKRSAEDDDDDAGSHIRDDAAAAAAADGCGPSGTPANGGGVGGRGRHAPGQVGSKRRRAARQSWISFRRSGSVQSRLRSATPGGRREGRWAAAVSPTRRLIGAQLDLALIATWRHRMMLHPHWRQTWCSTIQWKVALLSLPSGLFAAHELNWTKLTPTDLKKSTQLHDAVFGIDWLHRI